MDLLAFTVAILALLTAVAIFMVAHQPALTATHRGKAFAFVAFFVLPLTITGLAAAAHLEKAKSTEFCLSCHVMEPYGKSLAFADTDALPATHFQNRLVPRESACFTCHTTYTLFGDVKAKMNGMKHVWIYYTGQTPAKISLYQPYKNRECLSCHGESRSFLESAGHEGIFPDLRANTTSCLDCHSLVHDAQNLPAHATWSAPRHELAIPASAISLARPGALLALGLAIQAFTLFSTGPIPFLLYAGLGATLVLLGVADYLWKVLRTEPDEA